jgi:hypothetical protein
MTDFRNSLTYHDSTLCDSSDPKFDELIIYALSSQNEGSEIGILGFNPFTGQPLNMGVSRIL